MPLFRGKSEQEQMSLNDASRKASSPLAPLSLKNARGEAEQGNALIEFIVLGTTLMIPTMYFLITVFTLQSAAFAASNAGQQSLQYLQQSRQEHLGQGSAQAIAELAASDYGIAAEHVKTQVSCAASCAQGEQMTVSVLVEVPLPLVPWPGAPSIATMTSEATSWGGNYS